jgi:hypothetical protein
MTAAGNIAAHRAEWTNKLAGGQAGMGSSLHEAGS